jgi:hypothetical protein
VLFVCLAITYFVIERAISLWQKSRFHVIGSKDDPKAVGKWDGTVEQLSQGGANTQELWQLYQQSLKTGQSAAISTATLMKRMGMRIEEEENAVESSLQAPDVKGLLASPQTPITESMQISESYRVPANDFLSGRKLIVGTSGSGKSNSIGVYGEELGRLKVPFVLADTEDEYQPLLDWLSDGLLVGKTGRTPVSVENATQFGRYVLDNMKQVILNLQSYEMEEAAKVMTGIIAGMRAWQEERSNELRIPSDFILEEAVTWLPQQVNESPIKFKDPETFAMLQNTFFNDMVRKGRKRGLGITLVCQKIAELDNRAMQSDGRLLHRQTEEADLERYRKMGISNEETLSLQNGEAFLYTGRVSKKRLQVRKRHSPHGANTPGLEQLRRHQLNSRNTSETWGNFPEISGNQTNGGEHFDQPVEGFQNISAFRPASQNAQNSPQRVGSEIPEMIRKEIAERYADGMQRTKIRDDLQLNGDQYWMVRVVCDEIDQRRRAAGEK